MQDEATVRSRPGTPQKVMLSRLAAKARRRLRTAKEMSTNQQELARELLRDGKAISAVARTFDVHPATIYRVIEGSEALRRFSVPLGLLRKRQILRACL